MVPEPTPAPAPPAALQQVLVQQLLNEPQQPGKVYTSCSLGQQGLHGCPGLQPLQVLVPEGGGQQQAQQLLLQRLRWVNDRQRSCRRWRCLMAVQVADVVLSRILVHLKIWQLAVACKTACMPVAAAAAKLMI